MHGPCRPERTRAASPSGTPEDRRVVTDLSAAVGNVLRRARQRRGFTLQGASDASGGRFKPSAVGGYERGEREISLQRFCDLAEVYGASPDRLLAEALDLTSPEERQEVVIDLTRLPSLEQTGEGVLRVAEFVHDVRARRGDFLGEVLTLRSGDLDGIARAASMRTTTLRRLLTPAIRSTP